MNTMNETKAADAAALALKAHALAPEHEVLTNEAGTIMHQISEMVDLTEAPEDAVCSLVIDLLHYCEREKIDWRHDVMSRARKRLRVEREYGFEAR